MWLLPCLLTALLCSLAMVASVEPASEEASVRARVLTRARKRKNRFRIGTLNCRTLLDDTTLSDLDITLSENNISICALQEVRRKGLESQSTKNYQVFWYGEQSGYGCVGFAVSKKYVHLVTQMVEFSLWTY